MKKAIIITGIIILICSGVLGVTVNIKVDSFQEAKNKIVQWYDEVLVPLAERGFTVNKNI